MSINFFLRKYLGVLAQNVGQRGLFSERFASRAVNDKSVARISGWFKSHWQPAHPSRR